MLDIRKRFEPRAEELARNYDLVTKRNLKYRRYYHQFDY